MLEKIFERLDKAISNLDKESLDEVFPLILDDLNYILVECDKEVDKLSIEEQFDNGGTITDKKILYFSKLVQFYIKKVYDIDVEIVNTDKYCFALIGGGYNKNDGKIYFNPFGLLFGTSSKLSALHIFLHETCHKNQDDNSCKEDVLSFDPKTLLCLKEELLVHSYPDDNWQFYIDNYENLFFENEAEYYASLEIRVFVENLYQKYIENLNRKGIVDLFTIFFKKQKLKNLFSKIFEEEKFRINYDLVSQINGMIPISGEFIHEGVKKDKLIMMDKYIKEHPELQNKYPLLRLLFNGDTPKTYDEIITDREYYKKDKSEEEKIRIDILYSYIIETDPVLALTDRIVNRPEEVRKYLEIHPTLLSEYDEVKQLFSDVHFRKK